MALESNFEHAHTGTTKDCVTRSPEKQTLGMTFLVSKVQLVFFSFDFHFGDRPHLNGYFFNFQVGSFDSV